MKQKIIHILYEPSFMFGGVGTYVRELSNAQAENNEVYIVYINRFESVNYIDTDTAHNMISNSGYSFIKKLYDLCPKGIREYFKLLKVKQNIRKVLRITGYSNIVFHYHSPRIASLLTKFKNKNKFIQTVHGYLAFELLSDDDVVENSKGYKKLLEIEHNSYIFADMNICVDQKIQNHVKQLDSNAETVWHANFVNENKFKISSESKKLDLRSKYKIPNDKVVFITTRRFEIKNGIPVLAEALNLLNSDYFERAYFLFIGNGAEFNKVKNILEKSQANYKLCGAVPHSSIKDYYNLSDAFIIPSIKIKGVEEATSISTLEAMSCGNLVIASDIGGLKLLIDNGKNGYLIEDNNPELLARKIESLCDSVANLGSIRNNARESILEKFSLKDYSSFVDGIYSDIALDK